MAPVACNPGAARFARSGRLLGGRATTTDVTASEARYLQAMTPPRPSRALAATWLAALAVMSLLATGCDGCQKKQVPVTQATAVAG